MDARAVGNVVVNRHGEGIRFLKHHADPLAQKRHVDAAGVDVFAVEEDASLYFYAGDQVVHSVQGFQKGRFAAAGRPDQRRYFFFGDVDADIF